MKTIEEVCNSFLSRHEDMNEIYLHQNEREVAVDAMVGCVREFGQAYAKKAVEDAKKQWIKQVKKTLTKTP
jgi:hypothetical protein